jgi:hypothetical protein
VARHHSCELYGIVSTFEHTDLEIRRNGNGNPSLWGMARRSFVHLCSAYINRILTIAYTVESSALPTRASDMQYYVMKFVNETCASPGFWMNPYTRKNNTAFVMISVCPFIKDVDIYTMI